MKNFRWGVASLVFFVAPGLLFVLASSAAHFVYSSFPRGGILLRDYIKEITYGLHTTLPIDFAVWILLVMVPLLPYFLFLLIWLPTTRFLWHQDER